MGPRLWAEAGAAKKRARRGEAGHIPDAQEVGWAQLPQDHGIFLGSSHVSTKQQVDRIKGLFYAT